MFNKLSNLLLEQKLTPEEVNSGLMVMTNQGSIIDNSTMSSTDLGMVDMNFAETSEQLYDERVRIINERNTIDL